MAGRLQSLGHATRNIRHGRAFLWKIPGDDTFGKKERNFAIYERNQRANKENNETVRTESLLVIRLSEKFLSFYKMIINEQQFVLYYFIELSMTHFILFLLLCSYTIQ